MDLAGAAVRRDFAALSVRQVIHPLAARDAYLIAIGAGCGAGWAGLAIVELRSRNLVPEWAVTPVLSWGALVGASLVGLYIHQ